MKKPAVGEVVTVVRNRVNAHKCGYRSTLIRQGDTVTVCEIDGVDLYYEVTPGYRNFLPIKDVICGDVHPPTPTSHRIAVTMKALGWASPVALLVLTTVNERIASMNLGTFFEMPLVQNTNQAAYAAMLALMVAGFGWTTLKYMGHTFGQIADRRRDIRWREEDRQRAREQARRETNIADLKLRREDNDRLIQIDEKKARAKEEKKRRREEEEVARIQRIVQEAMRPIAVPLFERASTDTPSRTIGGAFYVTGVARFTRDTTNSAMYFDVGLGQLRTAKRGDIIQISEIKGQGGEQRIGYVTSNGEKFFANPSDLEMLTIA